MPEQKCMEKLSENKKNISHETSHQLTGVNLDQPILVDLLIEPNQSLSHPSFIAIMLTVGIITLGLSIFFLYLGAWPVLGFLGLDLVLLWFAFKLNSRSLKIVERIRMNDKQVMVTRESAQGKESWMFNSYWLSVLVKNEPRGKGYIQLASHGHFINIARYLTINERHELAEQIRSALTDSQSFR